MQVIHARVGYLFVNTGGFSSLFFKRITAFCFTGKMLLCKEKLVDSLENMVGDYYIKIRFFKKLVAVF